MFSRLGWIKRALFGAVLLFIILSVTPARVPSVNAGPLATNRYVATSGADAGDCSSTAAPCQTIQYAVNQSASGDEIRVAQGTYKYKTFSSTCTFLNEATGAKPIICIVDKILTILGGYTTSNWSTPNPAANPTVIDGENAHRGLFLIGYDTKTASLVMEGFTIQNGQSKGPDSASDPTGFGAGMMVVGARVTLRDMIFRNNKVYGQPGTHGAAAGAGLAIQWSQSGTSSLLERVTFDGNISYGASGSDRGGLAYGALFVNGSITVNYTTFTNNQARAGNSTGSGSSGGYSADALGGAMGGGGGTWVLQHITATGNQAVGGNATTNPGGGFGGAIYVEEGTSFTITDSYLSGNTAQGGNAASGGFGAGGAILVNDTPGTLNRVTIFSNSGIGGSSTNGGNAGAGGGGGLYFWTMGGSHPSSTVTNAIIADNYVALGSSGGASAGGGGGGVQVQGVQVTFNHTTFARNRLSTALVSGQGLLVLAASASLPGAATVNYSIIADHTIGGTRAVAVLVQEGNSITLNRGLFAGNTKNINDSNGPTVPGTISGLTTMLSASSAGFVSAGSPNYNYHILSDSAVKDKATGSTTPDDIDGRVRPFNGVSDIGADEYAEYSTIGTLYVPLVIR